MKAANGKRSNFRVPYGYRRDELDKEKWLVDEAAAEVVRRIYHLCLEGKGPEQIARLLQKEKVLTPTAILLFGRFFFRQSSYAERSVFMEGQHH